MRLILMRHGETEHNRRGLTLGRADAALNERGHAQARALASTLTLAPDAIYSSPLQRCAVTAESVSSATGCPIALEPDLIEMDVGEMEHLTPAELRERYPEFLSQWLSDDAGDARMPGGETLREVQARAWAAVERIRSAWPSGQVVVVTHNFVILTLACRALNLPLSEFRRLRQPLATRTVLDMQAGQATLLQLGDNAHLLAAGLGDDLTQTR